MQKPAVTEHPVHDLIRTRWSPRAFADKAIAPGVLGSLFEAARWAPSSNNEQPWAFIVGTKEDAKTFNKILGTLVEFNQGWAKNAAALVIAVSHLVFAKNGDPNRNAHYDTGAAVSQLTTEATARGLFVHQMAGFDAQKAVEAFGIPAGWDPIAVLAIGHGGEAESLADGLREREIAARTRKPLSEIAMAGGWGRPAAFIKK